MATPRIILGDRSKTVGIVDIGDEHEAVNIGTFTPNLLLKAIKAAKDLSDGKEFIEVSYCKNGPTSRSGHTLLIRFCDSVMKNYEGVYIAVAPRVEV